MGANSSVHPKGFNDISPSPPRRAFYPPIGEWTTEELCDWLKENAVSLPSLCAPCMQDKITGAALVKVKDNKEMKKLLSKGKEKDVERLMVLVERLRQPPRPPSSPPPKPAPAPSTAVAAPSSSSLQPPSTSSSAPTAFKETIFNPNGTGKVPRALNALKRMREMSTLQSVFTLLSPAADGEERKMMTIVDSGHRGEIVLYEIIISASWMRAHTGTTYQHESIYGEKRTNTSARDVIQAPPRPPARPPVPERRAAPPPSNTSKSIQIVRKEPNSTYSPSPAVSVRTTAPLTAPAPAPAPAASLPGVPDAAARASVSSAPARFCSSCGAENPDGGAYCGSCGKSTIRRASVSTQPPAPAATIKNEKLINPAPLQPRKLSTTGPLAPITTVKKPAALPLITTAKTAKSATSARKV